MDMTNWKISKTKKEYENRHFKIISHDVVYPDGSEGRYFTVDRTNPFSIIIPITSDEHTYLVGQYRITVRKFSWEFPMGSVDGKKPLDIAKQELKEETGLVATKWQKLGSFVAAPGYSNQWAYVYIAKELVQKEKEPEQGEFLEIKKLPMKKIGEMILSGKITDGPTICAYYFYLSNSTR